jgi:hypothetical protein
VTTDHWGFVLAAYGLAALVLAAYWRHLCRKERELSELARTLAARAASTVKPAGAKRP